MPRPWSAGWPSTRRPGWTPAATRSCSSNWYGQPNFRFHVYTKTDEPDPDTGYNFGVERESRKLIAWGGTTPDDEENGLGALRRVWFYDLSAGPESKTDNWNVDDADLDGDGVPDYRMPPIWEYTPGGYRAPSALSGDLALVARYVGINLLFTSSPLYPPDLTPPDLPHSVNIDANTDEGIPGVDASRRYIKPGLVLDELSELQPATRFSYDNQDLPFTGKARACYVQWLQDVPCYPALDYPGFANLFLYNALNLERTQDDAGRVDYELPNFNYATTDDLYAGFLGFADDKLAYRHPELRVQLLLAHGRRARLRAHHHDDPRGRPPPGPEPPARRLRLPDRGRLWTDRPVLLRLVQ
jgi:hypothetical protein